MTIPPLQNMIAFVRTAETGRLRAAAESLNVTESAVSHQLARLEAALNIRLLERGVQGVSLTDPGRIFYEQIQPALDDIDRAVRNVRGKSHNRVTVTMPQSFAAMWLAPRLHRIVEESPDIEIEILPTQRVCDLQREGIDFGIRTAWEAVQNETSTVLVQEEMSPVCTPGNAEKIKNLGWKRFIDEEGVLLNQLHSDEWDLWAKQYDMALPEKKARRTLSSFDLVTNAVATGLSVAIGRTPLIDTYLANGFLVQPFPEYTVKSSYYHLVSAYKPPLRGAQHKFYEWVMAEMECR
jgi:LysR family transcriptional regulator, glycine cleavage system transcriptional activator